MTSTNNNNNVDESEESKAHKRGAGHNDTVLDNVTQVSRYANDFE